MRLRTRLIIAAALALELIAISAYLPYMPDDQAPIFAVVILIEYAAALIVGLATAGPRLH